MALVISILVAGLSFLSEAYAARILATHFSGQIYGLDLTLSDSSNGTLKVSTQVKGCGVTPAWLHLDESTRTLYCFDESWLGRGVLQQYELNEKNASTTSLTLTGSATTPGGSVYGLLYGGPEGRSFVITTEFSPSTITTYKLPITSSTKQLQRMTFTMAGRGPRPDRQDRPHPHSAVIDPTGKFMLVPDLGADLTRILKIDQATGMLTSCADVASLPGDGPRHGLFNKVGGMEFNRSRKLVKKDETLKYYSVNELSNSVGVYDVIYPSSESGCLDLKLIQTLSTYGPDVPLGNSTVKAAEIRVAGDNLYVSNRGDSTFGFEKDSIAIFRIKDDGLLEFIELGNSYSYFPRSFVINKAGTLVAIGGQTTANVAVVERDVETGKLGALVANLVVPPRGTYGGEDGLSSLVWDE